MTGPIAAVHRCKRAVVAACLATLAWFGLPAVAAAQPARTPEEIGARIAETYGVEVLKLEAVAIGDDGRQGYQVTVMSRGGDVNGAFQVTRLIVDAATGELVPQFQHRAAGYDVSGAPGYAPPREADGLEIRRETYRN